MAPKTEKPWENVKKIQSLKSLGSIFFVFKTGLFKSNKIEYILAFFSIFSYLNFFVFIINGSIIVCCVKLN